MAWCGPFVIQCQWLTSSAVLRCHHACPQPFHPIYSPSTLSPRAPVCFCSCLQSGWLNDDLDQEREKCQGWPTKQSRHSPCANNVSSLSVSVSILLHLPVFPPSLVFPRPCLCLLGRVGHVSERTGSRGGGAGAGVCCQPRFEVSALTGSAARARDLKALSDISAQSCVTWQHACVYSWIYCTHMVYMNKWLCKWTRKTPCGYKLSSCPWSTTGDWL